MFLNKKKGATPEGSRGELEGIATEHGGTGQKVLAVMVGVTAAAVILGGVGYRYVYPALTGGDAPKAEKPKPVAETAPAAELNVPLDMERGDSAERYEPPSNESQESEYEPLPGLAGDAKPSPPGMRGTARPVGAAAQSLPPGMNNAGQATAAVEPSAGAGSQEDSPEARKLTGDLGDFDDDAPSPSRGMASAGAASDPQRGLYPECIGIRGGPAAEAECIRRMPPRLPAAAQAPVSGMPPSPAQGAQNGNALSSQLTAIKTPDGNVGRIPNPHLTLRKGNGITCSLDTAISSEQAGFVECVTDYPIYSMDGKVVLAERGTRLFGEYSRDVAPGSRSIFVLWTRGTTPAPHHVWFDLLSPGSDRLGRSGIQGDVDNKYWERYSGPLMFSFLQDVSTAVTSRAANTAAGQGQGNGVFVLPSTQSTGQNAVAELLKQGSEVKRSLYRNQGDTISITVARYIDFSPVYKLRTVKGAK